MCALDRDTKEHSDNWILSLDNVTMFLPKNQLNKSSFSNDIYIFLPGIVFFRTPCTWLIHEGVGWSSIHIL